MSDTTKRVRGGWGGAVVANTDTVVAIPNDAMGAIVTCVAAGGRVLVNGSATLVPLTQTSHGWMGANIPVDLSLYRGSDTYLHLGNAAATTFYVSFYN